MFPSTDVQILLLHYDMYLDFSTEEALQVRLAFWIDNCREEAGLGASVEFDVLVLGHPACN